MAIASGTGYFDAPHPETHIDDFINPRLVDRIVETRPTAVGVEFLVCSKKFSVAPAAAVNPGFERIPVLARIGTLCPLFTKDMELFRGEHLAPFPLCFRDYLRIILISHVPILTHPS
jgi:hypothetical protein